MAKSIKTDNTSLLVTDEEKAQLEKELGIQNDNLISKNLNTTTSIAKEGRKSDMQLVEDNYKNMQSRTSAEE